MKHAALLNLVLTHSFYRDGRCPDLTLAPSVETERLLHGHRCLWSAVPSGLRVLTAQDSSGAPFLPFAAGTVLRFHLALQSSDFVLITDLSSLSALTAPTLSSASLAPGQGGDLVPAEGSMAMPRGVLAAVELRLDGHGIGPAAPQFRAAFLAKQARWAYYCMTDLPLSGDELTIADTTPGGPPELLFSDGNRTRIDEKMDAAQDPLAVQFAGRYPGLRCVRLISDQAVACRQEPRRYLELRRGMERLSSSLPNPSVHNVVRLGAPYPSQDMLFQILQYRTRPFV